MPPDGRSVVHDWVAARVKGIDRGGLTDDTPLFEGRFLKSLHVPELILLLERLRARPIDVTGLRPGDFRDIDTIVGRFLP